MTDQNHMDDLLTALTEALLDEQYDLDHLIEEYNIPRTRVDGFVDLISNLRDVLAIQQPSDDFIKHLKQELVGSGDGLWERVRALPGRVQIAAGVALIAGFVLISRRRTPGDEPAAQPAEIPVLQQ
ncbi:MAG: hypothetical protein OHK0046_28230 [Anaerolineae bacterium]